MRALFISRNLIGDTLYTGPALRSWIKQHPEMNEIIIQTLPDHIAPLYQGMVRESYPEVPIRFLGAPSDMDTVNSESLYAHNIIRSGECMFGIPLNRLALIMQKARLLVTIDNGMSHLGASQETPTFLM